MIRRHMAIGVILLAGVAAASIPVARADTDLRVAATIAPIHSLVALVTEGIVQPDIIVRPGASPHDYALKPSEAQALNDADVVFWVGESLEPWMSKAVTTLAGDAVVVELGAVGGIERLPLREGGTWTAHSDGDGHGDHEHADDLDPHLWLDPENAMVWLDAIADTLADIDPSHAESFRKNADAASAEIEALMAEIRDLLAPVKDKPYAVFHDAYQYFEHRFDLHPLGAVSLSDADRPGPARLMEIRAAVAESDAVCVFAEPQFEPKLIETVIEGSEAKLGMLDPIGAGQRPGARLYSELIRNLAESLVDCLG